LTFASAPVLLQKHAHDVTFHADQLMGYVLHNVCVAKSAVFSAVLTSKREHFSGHHALQNKCRGHQMRGNTQCAACAVAQRCRHVQAGSTWQIAKLQKM